MSKKRNKSQIFQDALNEIEDLKADQLRELMKLNFRIIPKFKNRKQKLLAETIKKNRITFVTGAPGTGKTFIALKTGLELIKDNNSGIGDILLTTPIIEISPKSIGALPGDLDMKIINYFQHFYDNLNKMIDPSIVDFLRKTNIITDKIVNFMRGTTFGKYDEEGNPIGTYCILDECQNLTQHEVKSYISRIGENSKLIILGDPEQCDIKLPHGEDNGLVDAVKRFKDMDGIGVVEFEENDIVRDKFLIDVMKRYKMTIDEINNLN